MRVIPFGKPLIGREEKEAVLNVLNRDILVHGPLAKEFEMAFSKYTQAPHAVSVSSCTAAMHLAYFILGLRPGNEVIVPAQTHVATVHAVELCGAKPIFLDAEKRTGNIDIDQLESLISPQTKAIAVVHYLGLPVAMDRVTHIGKKYDVFVLEDCALALGSRYKGIHAGLWGDVGCFSFYPVKHITTAEGGMLITKHQQISEKISKAKAFGVNHSMGERKIPGFYDVSTLGFNYRLNELQSALGIEQLKKADHFSKQRKKNYEVLGQGLLEISEICQFESSHGDFQSSYYCASILLKNNLVSKRFEIIKHLNEAGVGTSIYYPKSIPDLSYYQEKYGLKEDHCPVASEISNSSIALPVGPHLNEEDMEYISKTLKDIIQKVSK